MRRLFPTGILNSTFANGSNMIAPGQKISHYQILEKLGGGGMGVVYQARDLKLERLVALKFLPHHLSADADAKSRFIQEAKSASALDHHNIGVIYEIDEMRDGQLFIAMAFYEGDTLKQRLAKDKLPVAQAIDLAIQMAQGLASAHKHGIVHRDIKPANAMLTKDGVVKIVDFGLAKLLKPVDHLAERLTRSGAILGTPPYMSPEQVRGIPVDHRTDLWSLGVVLYEMLTGQLPFQGDYELALLQAIAFEPHKSLQTYVPESSTALEVIVTRALMKNPAERYQSASEFIDDLHTPHSTTRPTRTIVAAPVGDIVILSDAPNRSPHESNLFFEKLRQINSQAHNAEERVVSEPGSNPYLNRLPIRQLEDFYGRHAELSRIYERIKAARPQSMSLVGIRRIGKSSLLRAIHHPHHRRHYLPNLHEYVLVLMDLQARRNVELPDFFQYIYHELEKEYRGRLQVRVAPNYDGMQTVAQTFHEAGLKLIFLWDEFESVTRNQKFGPEFYAFFRALASQFNLAYITSSADLLQSLCHAKEISDSPFFNIFTNLRLGAFKAEEARQLIAEPSARANRPLDFHADFILDIAGGFPFFIQIACAALFSLPRAGKMDLKKAKELFLEEARPHFKEYWERFSESEQAVVAALARERRLPQEHAFALKDLTQAGFVHEEKLFSSLFAEFVREKTGGNQPWWRIW